MDPQEEAELAEFWTDPEINAKVPHLDQKQRNAPRLIEKERARQIYEKKCAAMAKARAAHTENAKLRKKGLLPRTPKNPGFIRGSKRRRGTRPDRTRAEEIMRKRLAAFDRRLPYMLDAYAKASRGDGTALDEQTAIELAAKHMLRHELIEKIKERGVELEEPIMNADGQKVGVRIKVNPLLEALRTMDQDLGLTVEQARLSRRARGQGARDDAIAEALTRDARIRAASKLALPAPDPEILREQKDIIDTEAVAG